MLREQQLTRQVAKSTDPVYILTEKELYRGVYQKPNFTVFKGWINAYQIGAYLSYYQFSPRSVIDHDSKGPDKPEIDMLKAIVAGKQCSAIKDQPISYCTIPQTSHSDFQEFAVARHGEYILVTDIFRLYRNINGYRMGVYYNEKSKYDPEMAKSIQVLLSAEPINITDAKARLFRPYY